ncbi:MAG: hypothetical protein A3B04_00340 [Candidatus Portnoybacteria bacterium RIFCSPLOWO2_02_FULL_39_11]|uniref:Uncharacterized protein n=1 Tax=Candidatus Portnoybacteria bacterium RIFCSPLOWO2_02_FULL_39_11 TaxID=1802001 RepID=A0A1G2FR81_9BACT|nr:MAG: hypothetical protein A3B04_00340 [Candidatus Portnoybacteria bacterium RIFCSPLOWO2_02_FULL_39_11]
MKTELKEKIKNSGNNLHLSVVDILENEGWKVDISPYYCDDLTDRPREIDILATKRISMFSGSDCKEYFFKAVLCIECKHFTGDINFRVFDNNADVGREVLLNQNHNLNIAEAFKKARTIFNGHHYLTTQKIARLYEYWKNDQNKNQQEDDVFKAMTQSVKSTIFFMKSEDSDVLGSVYYPMVVYDNIDGIYLMQENCPDDEAYLDSLEPEKNVIFHLKYSYLDYGKENYPRYPTKDFFVDFVHKDELKKFVADVITEKECKKILSPILHDTHLIKT